MGRHGHDDAIQVVSGPSALQRASRISVAATSPTAETNSVVAADGFSAVSASQFSTSSFAQSTAARACFRKGSGRKVALDLGLLASAQACSAARCIVTLASAIAGWASMSAPGQPCRYPAQPPHRQVGVFALPQLVV